jgi:hypothetical protein
MVKDPRERCSLCGRTGRSLSPVEAVVLDAQPAHRAPVLSRAWGHLLDVVAEREPVAIIDAAPIAAARAECSTITTENLAYAAVNLGRLEAERLRRPVSGRKCLHVRLPKDHATS